MKVKLFPLSVVVVAVAAGLEAWISVVLRINPACDANGPHGGAGELLGLPLLLLALPGWIGLMVLEPLTAPLRYRLPIRWADGFSLACFYFAQMFAYFLVAHGVRWLVLSLRPARSHDIVDNAGMETSGKESQRDVSS